MDGAGSACSSAAAAILCRSGTTLFEFVPAGEILQVAEAILRVFHRLGDYEHKQRNRMKFLIKSLGWERYRTEVEAALAAVQRERAALLPFDPDDPPIEPPPTWTRDAAPAEEEIAALQRRRGSLGPAFFQPRRTRRPRPRRCTIAGDRRMSRRSASLGTSSRP